MSGSVECPACIGYGGFGPDSGEPVCEACDGKGWYPAHLGYEEVSSPGSDLFARRLMSEEVENLLCGASDVEKDRP